MGGIAIGGADPGQNLGEGCCDLLQSNASVSLVEGVDKVDKQKKLGGIFC